VAILKLVVTSANWFEYLRTVCVIISFQNVENLVYMETHFAAFRMKVMQFRVVFWVILPCKIILHGSITQNTTLNIILAAVRTWNLTTYYTLK
jgi:hypothetical protein